MYTQRCTFSSDEEYDHGIETSHNWSRHKWKTKEDVMSLSPGNSTFSSDEEYDRGIETSDIWSRHKRKTKEDVMSLSPGNPTLERRIKVLEPLKYFVHREESMLENETLKANLKVLENQVKALKLQKLAMEDHMRHQQEVNAMFEWPTVIQSSPFALGTKPSHSLKDKGTKPSHSLEDKGTKPSHSLEDKGTRPSHSLEDVGTRPSHSLKDKGTWPSHSMKDKGTWPSHSLEDMGTRPSHSLEDMGTWPSHYLEDMGTWPSHYLEDMGTWPSHYLEVMGTKPSHSCKHTTMTSYQSFMKLYLILTSGAAVLRFILKHGTSSPTPPLYLFQYLNNLPENSTAAYKYLTRAQKSRIFSKAERQDLETIIFSDTFNIVLLFKAIMYACERVAGPHDDAWMDPRCLEGLVREIKTERHRALHVGQTRELIELRNLFVKTYEAAQDRYNIADLEIALEVRELDRNIHFTQCCFAKEDDVHFGIDKQLTVFKHMFATCLHKTYGTQNTFDRPALNTYPKMYLSVADTFTKILIGECPQDYKDIFELLQQERKEESKMRRLGMKPAQPHSSHTTQQPEFTHVKNPQLLFIEGDAGTGKTTLMALICSEWLKSDGDRRIKLLQKYDLVLRVQCRERDCTSLEEYVEQVLPEAAVFRPNTLTLLRNCSVLFLIDGLDECNSISRCLVIDILDQFRHNPETTIIGTYRPTEVLWFLSLVPEAYETHWGTMKGIPPCDRTKFVLSYYDCLDDTRYSAHDELRQIMENIGWRDHFALPLNLIFVATLFNESPDSVREISTQTSLYDTLHAWQVQKLVVRLDRNLDAETPLCRIKEGIMRVLDSIRQAALDGLMENRQFLSDKEMSRLWDLCRSEKLPTEVMGAFSSVTQSVTAERYYTFQKSLQEFFAANYIVNYLLKDSPEETMRQLLHKPSKRTLQMLRNVLLHVLGLLSTRNEPRLSGAVEDVVDLLAESGVKKCNDWMELLHNTNVSSTALDRVVRHIENYVKGKDAAAADGDDDGNGGGGGGGASGSGGGSGGDDDGSGGGGGGGDDDSDDDDSGDDDSDDDDSDDDDSDGDRIVRAQGRRDVATIKDKYIPLAKQLLPRLASRMVCLDVCIELHCSSSDVHELIFEGHKYTQVCLWYHYKQPHQAPPSDPCLLALPRRHLRRFAGRLTAEGLELLREMQHLAYLHLAVRDDLDAQEVLPAITEVCPSIRTLKQFYLHVPVQSVTPDRLTIRLFDDTFVSLLLSGVDETMLEKASVIAAALQPNVIEGYPGWYSAMIFPNNTMTASVWRSFLDTLKNDGVRIGGFIVVPKTSPITRREAGELTMHACARSYRKFSRMSDKYLWRWPL